MRSACPPIMYGCKYLNFTSKSSEDDLLARRIIHELEGLQGDAYLEEYADASTERGQCMLKRICEKLGFASSLWMVFWRQSVCLKKRYVPIAGTGKNKN